MTSDRTRSKKCQNYKGIEEILQSIPFSELARTSGFNRRKARKITGRHLLLSFMIMATQGRNTFQHWAEHLSILSGKQVSRQGIWKRVNTRLTPFLLAVLSDAFRNRVRCLHRQGALKGYGRVLLQDSTTISLPDALAWCFPGSVSKGKKKAQLKIQAVYDLLNDKFIHFWITPYAENDQSRSGDILSIATGGDLVIRDLGYFVLKCFKEMQARGISFISRLRFNVNIHDPGTGDRIDLLRSLRKKGGLDRWVLLGKEQVSKVRLVVLKLPEKQAEERRRKARQDRDKRVNHSKEYYELLGYNVFITTEDSSKLTMEQIARLYGCRWRIESIFKCWKSHFSLQRIIPGNATLTKERVEAIIYMMLIFILLFQVNIYNHVLKETERMTDRIISLLKMTRYIANHMQRFLTHDLHSLMPDILRHCCYDKRNDRMNFIQKSKLS
jgi:hypothetical protein